MRTPLNVLLHGHFLKYLSLSMHLLPRMSVMLDFIWMLSVHLRGTRNKWTLPKILSAVGFEPPRRHGLQITSRLSLPLGHSNVTNEGIKLNVIRVNMYILHLFKLFIYRLCEYDCRCSLAVPWYNICIALKIDQWNILLLFLTVYWNSRHIHMQLFKLYIDRIDTSINVNMYYIEFNSFTRNIGVAEC